jgi:hypothetical protein
MIQLVTNPAHHTMFLLFRLCCYVRPSLFKVRMDQIAKGKSLSDNAPGAYFIFPAGGPGPTPGPGTEPTTPAPYSSPGPGGPPDVEMTKKVLVEIELDE